MLSKELKIGLMVAVVVLAIMVTLWVATGALALMNTASDIAVGAGTLIMLGLGLGWIVFISKMKKMNIIPVMIILGLSSLVSLNNCTRIQPGYVGIKVNLAGDNRGVDEIPLQNGWVFFNIFTQKVYEYPTFVQTAVWTASKGRISNQ
jgi:hypothetical protein